MDDLSNGWEAVAAKLIAYRSRIGVDTVRRWAAGLPRHAAILDLGCGHGDPIATMLTAEGFGVAGIDASPTLAAAFRARFPDAPVACEAAETSAYFDRQFDAAIAIGLLFLLPEHAQRALLGRLPSALRPGGRLLFTAPIEVGVWQDSLTGRDSVSLGRAVYVDLLATAGLALVAEYVNEGESHYYDAIKLGGCRE